MSYPHNHLWINGRNILFKDVVENKVSALSDFENSTFAFIRSWMAGEQHFTIRTSGSTGKPKEITITREQMTASARLTQTALGLNASFSALTCLDTTYIAGKMMLVRSLEIGMKIFAVDPCANPLCKIPVDRTIHFAALVPYQIKAILESKHPHLLDKLSICLIGGAPLDGETKEKLNQYSVCCYATYGMTETISHVALQLVNGKNQSPYFETLEGVSIELDDRGCLTIAAPYLEEKIVTNDLAEIVDKRVFNWLGRWDNVINSGGVKVVPENVEKKIGQIFTRLHISSRYFIHGIPDDKLGQKVILILESGLSQDQLQDLKSELHSFPPYEIPKEIFEAPSFVYTDTGKINRAESFKAARLTTSIKK